jgi:predicted TIM-barrel fold metal-dependent hydrolase
MAGYKVISADNHVVEPSDMWTTRSDAKYKDRMPQIVREESGADWWYCDGYQVVGVELGTQAGLRFEAPEEVSMHRDTFENTRLGGYIPEEHVKDMALDGIDSSIVYPSTGLLLYSIPDTDLLTHIFKVYNDWVAEFCSANPKVLKGIAMVNVDEVGVGVKELERCAKLGFVGAMITVYPPAEVPYSLPMYEPLWAAAQDLQIPLSLHIATNRPGPGQEFQNLLSTPPWFLSNVDHWVRESIGQMIFTGVFERYPKLQVGAVEMELSWVPHFLDRIDYTYTQRQIEFAPYRFKEDMLPSDYFHRNVFLGFQEDAVGIRLRDIIGVDSLMWGGDYPHPESTFPKSQEILENMLVDCTEEEKAKITGGNATRIYNLN